MRRSQIEARIGEIRGERHFSDARARGRGVILLTAHFGSFEVGAAALTRIEPGVHIVFQRDPFPAFERFRARSRRTLGLLEAPIDDGPATWLRLRDALAAGGSVLMQGDLAMPGQGAMESQIGAGRIMLPTGPYRLSTMTGAAVIPVFAPRRRDGRVDLIIKAPIECAPHGDVGGAVAAMAASLTEIISRHPEQWIMPRAVFLP